jgi:hypothetical protein
MSNTFIFKPFLVIRWRAKGTTLRGVILPEGCLHGKVQYDSRIEIDEGGEKRTPRSLLFKRDGYGVN